MKKGIKMFVATVFAAAMLSVPAMAQTITSTGGTFICPNANPACVANGACINSGNCVYHGACANGATCVNGTYNCQGYCVNSGDCIYDDGVCINGNHHHLVVNTSGAISTRPAQTGNYNNYNYGNYGYGYGRHGGGHRRGGYHC